MIETFVALMLLDALLLWAIVRTRGWWAPKAVAIVVVLGFNFAVLGAQGSFDGYATTRDLPAEAVLVSCYVDEPSAVYLWLTGDAAAGSVFGYEPRPTEPRAYKLPYTRSMHAQCQAAQQEQARGVRVGVVRSGEGRRTGRPGRAAEPRFYRLPPAQVQPKEG